MKHLASIFLSLFVFAVAAQAQTPAPPKPPLKSHALAKVASVAVAPVVHPKRTLKQTLGAVLFGVENVVDVAHSGLAVADKALDAVTAGGVIPALNLVYVVVEQADKDSGKLDLWLERQEQGLFGTHN